MIRLDANSEIRNTFNSENKIMLFKDSVLKGITIDPKTKLSYVDSKMKPWMEQYIRYATQPRFRVIQGIKDFFLGVQYRYPLCCVFHFCWDTFWGRAAGTRRGSRHTQKTGTYVPCFRCKNLSCV